MRAARLSSRRIARIPNGHSQQTSTARPATARTRDSSALRGRSASTGRSASSYRTNNLWSPAGAIASVASSSVARSHWTFAKVPVRQTATVYKPKSIHTLIAEMENPRQSGHGSADRGRQESAPTQKQRAPGDCRRVPFLYFWTASKLRDWHRAVGVRPQRCHPFCTNGLCRIPGLRQVLLDRRRIAAMRLHKDHIGMGWSGRIDRLHGSLPLRGLSSGQGSLASSSWTH